MSSAERPVPRGRTTGTTGAGGALAALASIGLASCGRSPIETFDPTELRGELPIARVGEPFEATLEPDPPGRVVLPLAIREGRLAPGLALDAPELSRVRVAGVPVEPGRFEASIALRLDRPNGLEDVIVPLAVEVEQAPVDGPVRIAVGGLPDGTVGEPYEARVEVEGGRPPYALRSLDGLPPGLVLSEDGRVTGVPGRVGAFGFTVRALDADGSADQRRIALDVFARDRPRVSPRELPTGRIALPYEATLTGAGGDGGPYDWRVVGGRFPLGLSLSSPGGTAVALRGAPTEPGRWSVALELEDTSGTIGLTQVELRTVGPLRLAAVADLPEGRVGEPYALSLPVLDALPPVTARLRSGAFPPGVGLVGADEDAVRLSGAPTAAGAYRFELEVEDRLDRATRSYVVTVR